MKRQIKQRVMRTQRDYRLSYKVQAIERGKLRKNSCVLEDFHGYIR